MENEQKQTNLLPVSKQFEHILTDKRFGPLAHILCQKLINKNGTNKDCNWANTFQWSATTPLLKALILRSAFHPLWVDEEENQTSMNYDEQQNEIESVKRSMEEKICTSVASSLSLQNSNSEDANILLPSFVRRYATNQARFPHRTAILQQAEVLLQNDILALLSRQSKSSQK